MKNRSLKAVHGAAIALLLFMSAAMAFAGGAQETAPAAETKAAEMGEGEGQRAEPYNLKEYESMTGKKLTFKEAPMLAEMVQRGQLPPVKERVPKNPLVVKPVEEIGQYGGTFRLAHRGSYDVGIMKVNYLVERPTTFRPDMTTIFPHLLEGYDANADGSSFVLHLREGLKWNDGEALNADDFLFFFNDIALNTDLNPAPSFVIGGPDPAKMTKVDDYTLRVDFNRPFGIFIENISRHRPVIYAPEHYLKQFHPDYTSMSEIKKRMDEGDYDRWQDLFGDKDNYVTNPDRPNCAPWIPQNTINDPIQLYDRNPYYWKVDTEGNQLPYIDHVERILVGDTEAILLKMLAGEIDLERGLTWGGMPSYTVVMENRDKGDYRVIAGYWANDSYGTCYLNYENSDPELKKLFNDRRFRIALSVAIDRDELNQLIFEGLGLPNNASVALGPPYYGENFFLKY